MFPIRERKSAGEEVDVLKVLTTGISKQLEELNSLTPWNVLMD